MQPLTSIFDWLSGNGQYMNLIHCMGHDTFWISLTVTLDVAVACGYIVIAMHWWKNQRLLPDVPAKHALAQMRNIFVFCGLCGYIFIPIKMFWPAWRLYDFFMMSLVYFTWRYAINAGQLRVVYRELGRSSQLEKDLEQSRAESDRRTWFLNAVSHDLRTPLNAVSLYTSLAELKIETNDIDGQREAVAAIRDNTSSISRMLNALLSYASLECAAAPLEVSSFELNRLLETVVDRSAPSASAKKLTLGTTCPSGLNIRTDHGVLERILDNLISNAIKYTETGSVRIKADATADDVEIHVIDTGIGIPTEAHPRVFEEFFQIGNSERNSAKGFGLGLAIARRLAEQLGGQIALESSPGRGSRFSILLPRVVAKSIDVPVVENGTPIAVP